MGLCRVISVKQKGEQACGGIDAETYVALRPLLLPRPLYVSTSGFCGSSRNYERPGLFFAGHKVKKTVACATIKNESLAGSETERI